MPREGHAIMWEKEFLDELLEYLAFTPEHARCLAAMREHLRGALPQIVERFYDAIVRNPQTIAVFTGGKAQIERQKGQLTEWLLGLMGGVYDVDYLRKRALIGRTHVRIKLEQRYMFGAMNVIRGGLHAALDGSTFEPARKPLGHQALDKICDFELAVMLETYSQAYLTRMQDVERLATLGQLSGFIGHELRNPLAVMETSLHLLRKRIPIDDARAQRHLQRLSEQLSVSREIIANLLELASDRALTRRKGDLSALVAGALDGLPEANGIAVEVEIADELPVPSLDDAQVGRLVANLVSNACYAAAEREHPWVGLRAFRSEDAVVIVVEDNGDGIADNMRHRLFESLATTRSNGLGLGLALCRRIAEKHGGSIRAEDRPEGGARFEVRLPGAFEG